MAGKAIDELARELGRRPPKGLSKLKADEQRDLAGLLAQARHEEARQFAIAADESLSHLPRLLRGPVRKALGG